MYPCARGWSLCLKLGRRKTKHVGSAQITASVLYEIAFVSFTELCFLTLLQVKVSQPYLLPVLLVLA